MAVTRSQKTGVGSQEQIDPDIQENNDLEYDAATFNFDCKDKVECICPKCGVRHTIVFRWIGRGVPRKFCKSCTAVE